MVIYALPDNAVWLGGLALGPEPTERACRATFGPGFTGRDSRAAGLVVRATYTRPFCFFLSIRWLVGLHSLDRQKPVGGGSRRQAAPRRGPRRDKQTQPLRARPSWRVGGLGGARWAKGGADEKARRATPLPPNNIPWPAVPD